LTHGTVYCTFYSTVKSIGVTELRQRTAEILEALHAAEEPVAILQRSQTTAYLVDAKRYEAEREELRAARRALFLREVREAEAEYVAGGSTAFEDMDALLDDLRG
jgi:prevent-host-death family protein